MRCAIFNHARTLLANLPPFNGQPSSHLAEELIDPGFVPVRLPGYLVAVRKVFFGNAPDRDMVNYRTRQLITLVHSTSLVEFVYELDQRVTYSTGEDVSLVGTTVFAVNATPLAGEPPLVTFGGPEAPDQQGVVARSYLVKVLTPETVDVAQAGFPDVVFDFEMDSGLSTPFALPDSGYEARLSTDVPGSGWLVEVRNRPQWDVGQLVVLLDNIGEGVLENLFAGGEPFVSFRNAWKKEKETPLRLGSAVMALVLKSEEIRNGGR